MRVEGGGSGSRVEGHIRGKEVGFITRRQHAGALVPAGHGEDQRENACKGGPGCLGPLAVDLVVPAVVHPDHARAWARHHPEGPDDRGWMGALHVRSSTLASRPEAALAVELRELFNL